MPSPTINLGTADEITIVGDENGFELHLVTINDVRYTINIHNVAPELLKEARREIGDWLDEAECARASRPLRDDQDAYAPDDPKHPDWHSVHVDHYDGRAK